jgi:hypothetical protein
LMQGLLLGVLLPTEVQPETMDMGMVTTVM